MILRTRRCVVIKEIEERCPECNGKLRETLIETYCTKCGLVIDDSPIVAQYNEHRGPPKSSLEPFLITIIDKRKRY